MPSAIFLLVGICLTSIATSFAWEWKCEKENCIRTRSKNSYEIRYPSVEICRLVCGKNRALWPQPTKADINTELYSFSSQWIQFHYDTKSYEVMSFLTKVSDIYLDILNTEDTTACPDLNNSVIIDIKVASKDTTLALNTNESYTITINIYNETSVVLITAETVFGARHALETFSQLTAVYPKDDKKCLVINTQAEIVDAPVYPHRGLLLDTARNFQPIVDIKKHIDAMAASKLNVLHWHVTDSQSFPLEIPSLPNMTKFGAYSDNQIYKTSNVEALVQYAKLRGVRVVIEIDAPSHAGNGWQWGPDAGLGNLTVCANQQPWRSFCIEPPCGQLNPVNDKLFGVLTKLYGDVMNLLPKGEIFHMGADEISFNCWNKTEEIVDYLNSRSKPRTKEWFLNLWSEYQKRALAALDTAVGHNKTRIVVWINDLTEINQVKQLFNKERYILQPWVSPRSTLPEDLVKNGYQIIVSSKPTWYLDHGFWSSTRYQNWKSVYSNKMLSSSLVLGGEVCMWGEYVDNHCAESRTWPRAAAAAERLWSNPSSSANYVAPRFYRHRERLISRGIKAEAVTTTFCYQNDGQC